MDQAARSSMGRPLVGALLLAMAAGVAFGWWGRAQRGAREPTPDLQMNTITSGRLEAGGGWFVKAHFTATDIGDRQVALEVYAFRGGRQSERVPVRSGDDRAQIELQDPPKAADGRWWATGWWPGPAWVRLVLLENGRRVYASDEWPIELSRGDGFPGAFPVPARTEGDAKSGQAVRPTPQGKSPDDR